MLDIWDEQLASLCNKIYEYRNGYVDKLKEKIEVIHSMITNSGKEPEILKLRYMILSNKHPNIAVGTSKTAVLMLVITPTAEQTTVMIINNFGFLIGGVISPNRG